MTVHVRRRPVRLLLTTFDLTDTRPGDSRYRAADETLAMYGQLFKPIKQVRLLISRRSPEVIKLALQQRIGREASVMITPITALPAWRIHGRAKQQEWRRFVAAMQAAGVHVTGLADTVESA